LANPLLSVVTPVYNDAAFVHRAIESVLSQTYSNWELLICDDGSTDDTIAVLKKYAAHEPRIRLLSNEVNRGHVFTYNRLFFEAKGDYLAILDADDWCAPERLARQLATVKEKQADFCFCKSRYHRPDGTDFEKGDIADGFLDIFSEEHYDPATIFFKRAILEKVPGFHVYFERLIAMDRYFILCCLSHFKGYYINEPLYHVLIRTNSDHRSIDERYIRKLSVLDAYYLLRKQRRETGTDWLAEGKEAQLLAYEQQLLSDRRFMAEKYQYYSCIQLDHKKVMEGWALARKAFQLNPWRLQNLRTLFYAWRLKTRQGILKARQ